MTDFEHRLVAALERLAGRGDDGPPPLALIENRLAGLIIVLEDIRDRLAERAHVPDVDHHTSGS